MKNLFNIFIVTVLTITTATSQINNNKINIHNKINLSKDKLNVNIKKVNLNLETIKNNIRTRKKCYKINVTTTAIFPPQYPKKVYAMDGYYSSTDYVKIKGDYITSNGLLLRSDANFSKFKGNNYSIEIYPYKFDPKSIDYKRVFVIWHRPGKITLKLGLINVSVQYTPYGIVIIGQEAFEGIYLGVTISITPSDCLI